MNSSSVNTTGLYILKAEAPTKADSVLLYIGISFYGLTVLAFLYACINYKYPLIRAKQLPVVGLSLGAGFCWWLGSMASTSAIENVGLFSVCLLWKIWFQFLGLWLYVTCILFRLSILHRILIQQKISTLGLRLEQVIAFLGLFLPGFLVVVISSCFPSATTAVSEGYYLLSDGTLQRTSDCVVNSFVSNTMISLVLCAIIVMAYFSWSLRSITRAFNERNESMIGLALIVVSFIINVSILLSGYFKYVWGRTLINASILIVTLGYIWMVIFPQIYISIFNRAEGARRFKDDLTLSYALGSQASDLDVSAKRATQVIPLQVVESQSA